MKTIGLTESLAVLALLAGGLLTSAGTASANPELNPSMVSLSEQGQLDLGTMTESDPIPRHLQKDIILSNDSKAEFHFAVARFGDGRTVIVRKERSDDCLNFMHGRKALGPGQACVFTMEFHSAVGEYGKFQDTWWFYYGTQTSRSQFGDVDWSFKEVLHVRAERLIID